MSRFRFIRNSPIPVIPAVRRSIVDGSGTEACALDNRKSSIPIPPWSVLEIVMPANSEIEDENVYSILASDMLFILTESNKLPSREKKSKVTAPPEPPNIASPMAN